MMFRLITIALVFLSGSIALAQKTIFDEALQINLKTGFKTGNDFEANNQLIRMLAKNAGKLPEDYAAPYSVRQKLTLTLDSKLHVYGELKDLSLN